MPRKRKSDAVTPVGGTKPVVVTNYTVQSSPLLSLSPELRNAIFELVCRNTTMVYHRQGMSNMRNGMPRPPGFLMACKQIYYESAEVFYATASFEFNAVVRRRGWLSMIRDDDVNIVQRVLLKELAVESVHFKQEKKVEGSLFWIGTAVPEAMRVDRWVTCENIGVTIRKS